MLNTSLTIPQRALRGISQRDWTGRGSRPPRHIVNFQQYACARADSIGKSQSAQQSEFPVSKCADFQI